MTKILIADEASDNRSLLTALFAGHGFDVVPACDGAEALALARRMPPDLIFTDMLTPTLDGFELCRRWQQDENLKSIPFIIYTAAHGDAKDEQLAKSLGADRFLIKPQPPETLLQVVREVLQKTRGMSPAELERSWSDAIVSAAPSIIVGLGERSRILVFNRAAETITGYSAHEVLGKEWIDIFIPPEMQQKLRDVWDTVLTERLGPHQHENIIVTKTGERRLISWHNSVLSEAGRFGMVLSIGEDITERKRAEEELQASLALLRIASEIARFGGWSAELRSNRCTWSDAVADIHEVPRGYSPSIDEALEFYAPPWHDRVTKIFSDCAQRGFPYDEEMEIITKLGTRVWVRTVGAAVRDEEGKIIKVQGAFQEITAQKQIEQALRQSEERLKLTLQATRDGIWDRNLATGKAVLSPSYYAMLGYEDGEFPATDAAWKRQLHPEDVDRIGREIERCTRERNGFAVEYRMRTKADEWRWILSRGMVVEHDARGRAVRMVGTHTDVTERVLAQQRERELHQQLMQAQKMESIGRLAGGVAHDFNNLLCVVLSYASFALEAVSEDNSLRADLEEIRRSSEHAAILTRQLLAFSRRQILAPEVINPNQALTDIEGMLSRLLGEDIIIDVRVGENLGNVVADPGQFEQLIMNLAVNARDAMPNGGKLTLETQNVVIDERNVDRHRVVKPGRFVLLSVTDDGCGMDAETKEHLFEPFFTTKEKGKGTGLGLSTVYGIVRQSGGDIWVDSEPGQGTSFKVYLPRVDTPVTATRRRSASALVGGNETVLLVEDEESVRKISERILRNAGYKVLAAASGNAALLLYEQYGAAIDLLLTDVVMPKVGGRELANRLLKLNPKLKVLFMSGYADNAIVHNGMIEPGTHFIGKPFAAADLTRRVRDVLDADEQ